VVLLVIVFTIIEKVAGVHYRADGVLKKADLRQFSPPCPLNTLGRGACFAIPSSYSRFSSPTHTGTPNKSALKICGNK